MRHALTLCAILVAATALVATGAGAASSASGSGSFATSGSKVTTDTVGKAKTSPTSAVHFTMSEQGPYACLGPCATAVDFVVTGTANSAAFGRMTVLGIGHVDGKANARNCLPQSERWSFTSKGHGGQDSFETTTRGDKICFNKDFSAAIETADFAITGGTGKFKAASGSGHFKFNVLSSPQKGGGTIAGTLRLP